MLCAGQRLGDYEIIRRLGKGGMGEVYEARQGHPERLVALKILASWLAEDPGALERFWREAEVPARLNHPNIVRIITTGTDDEGRAFYTMELVQGVSLSQLIRSAAEVEPPTVTAPTDSMDNSPRPDPGSSTPVALAEQVLNGQDDLPVFHEYRRDCSGITIRI